MKGVTMHTAACCTVSCAPDAHSGGDLIAELNEAYADTTRPHHHDHTTTLEQPNVET